MYLSPTDQARLDVFTVASLARELLRRGLRLNAPEATALVCDEMHLAARAGAGYDETLVAGRRAVRREQLLDGVPDLVDEIRLEVLFEEGSRLLVLHRPWSGPGGSRVEGAPVTLNGERPRRRLAVTNTSTRVVRVSSHYPFWRTNRRLEFDRAAAHGFRLDVPAGVSVRWTPGQTREVDLVALGTK
ncbi:urease subunit beta [Pseudonocardia acaciae]|uniref:urease subunit beta n=1 Tax=Pseudonocardia acaciae TaxID=551276 RepID=UPI0005654921